MSVEAFKKGYQEGIVLATSTTVSGGADPKVEINAPARAGQVVNLVSASYTTDTAGRFMAQDVVVQSIACVTTNTSTTVTSAALFGDVTVGMRVQGTGIDDISYVTVVTDPSTITISNAATATGTPTLTFGGTNKFHVGAEARTTTLALEAFTPSTPIPVSSAGNGARFVLNATAGRLSVAYFYSI